MLPRECLGSPPQRILYKIIHVGDRHWAFISNIFCENNAVELYDSLHIEPGDTVQEQVNTTVNCESADIIIKMINAVHQQSEHSC